MNSYPQTCSNINDNMYSSQLMMQGKHFEQLPKLENDSSVTYEDIKSAPHSPLQLQANPAMPQIQFQAPINENIVSNSNLIGQANDNIAESQQDKKINQSSVYNNVNIIQTPIIQQQNGLAKIWQKNGLMIIVKIMRFVSYLKSYSQQYKFRDITQQQLFIIKDNSLNYKFYKFYNFLNKEKINIFEKIFFVCYKNFIKRKINYIINNTQLKKCVTFIFQLFISIPPDSPIKIMWDSFILFLLIANIFYIPIKMSYKQYNSSFSIDQWSEFIFEDLPQWTFISDILLNFNTAYYKKGILITQRSQIIRHYLKGKFFWDTIIIIPFFISQTFSVQYMDAILLLRSNKILNISNSLVDLLNFKDKKAALYELVKLIFFILFIAHFCGCGFYIVANIEYNNDYSSTSWLFTTKMIDQSWTSQYIISLYWATITMITVGYGDIVPVSTIERVYVIFVTLISCGVFAYAVSQIQSIVLSLTKKNSNFKAKMVMLAQYMKKRKVSKELQMKIKKYFEYINDESKEEEREAQDMLFSQLPMSFRMEVKQEIYQKIFMNKKILKLNFSEQFLQGLTARANEQQFGPEEQIFSENDNPQRLYFLVSGDVELYIKTNNDPQQSKFVIKNLKKGDIFGEHSFFSEKLTEYGAMSTNLINLVYITKQDFMEIITAYPNDLETYYQIKDSINLYKNMNHLGIQCYGCCKFTHTLPYCNYVNLIPNQFQIIKKYQDQDKPNQRQKNYARNPNKKLDTRTCAYAESLKVTIIQFLINQSEQEEIPDLVERILNIQKHHQQTFTDDQVEVESQQQTRLCKQSSLSSDKQSEKSEEQKDEAIDQQFKIQALKQELQNQQQQINQTQENQLNLPKKRNIFRQLSYTQQKEHAKNNQQEQGLVLDNQQINPNVQLKQRKASLLFKENNLVLTQQNNEKTEEVVIQMQKNQKNDIVKLTKRNSLILNSNNLNLEFEKHEKEKYQHNQITAKAAEENQRRRSGSRKRRVSSESSNQQQELQKKFQPSLQNIQLDQIQQMQSSMQQQTQQQQQSQYSKQHSSKSRLESCSSVSQIFKDEAHIVESFTDQIYQKEKHLINSKQRIQQNNCDDKMQIFKSYFIHNNVDKVLNNYQIWRQKKQNIRVNKLQTTRQTQLINISKLLELPQQNRCNKANSPRKRMNANLQSQKSQMFIQKKEDE